MKHRSLMLIATLLCSSALALTGCTRCSKKEVLPSTLSALQPPTAVIGFGGSDDLQQVLNETAAFAGQVHPLAGSLPVLARTGLQRALGLTSLDGVDLSKPMRFVIVGTKSDQASTVVLLRMTGKDKLLASLPPGKREKHEGNAVAYPSSDGGPRYINFIGETAAFTPDKNVFAAHEAFYKQLLAAKATSNLVTLFPVKNIYALYGDKLRAQLKSLEQLASAAPPAGLMPGQPSAAAAARFTARPAAWALGLVEALDRGAISYRVSQSGMRLGVTLQPRAGNDLQKTYESLEVEANGLLSRLPSNAEAFMAFKLRPALLQRWAGLYSSWFGSLPLPGGDDQLLQTGAQRLADVLGLATGEYAIAAFSPPNEKTLAVAGLWGLKEPAKARQMVRQVAEAFTKSGVLAGQAGQLGMKYQYIAEAYKVGDVPVSVGGLKPNSGVTAPVSAPIDTMAHLTFAHSAISKDVGYFAFGPSARPAMEALIGNKLPGGLDRAPHVKRAFEEGAPNAFLLAYASVGALVRLMQPGLPSEPAAKPAPATARGIAVSAGADHGALHIVLDLPSEQATAIGEAMRTAMARSLARP